jgi:hypothetical protein
MSSLRFVTVLSVAALLGGCAGMSEQACLMSDWRSVGFEDGTLGRPVGTIGNYRQACVEHGVSPDLDAYRAGHAQGVEVYCRAAHGFEVGRSGALYQGVCPANLVGDFLASYNSGRRLYELESALRRVEGRIASDHREQQSIRDELTSIAAKMVASDTTTEQRVLMVSRSSELGRRYGELTAEIENLERERVVHELALHDYQQTLAAGF